MKSTSVASKLAELRSKTDRDLVHLIEHELERGLRAASTALNSANASDFVQAVSTRAERAYAEAVVLLPTVHDISGGERRRLESRIEALRNTLDELAARRSAVVRPDAPVAAVAYALWRARGCVEGSPERDWYHAEKLIAGGHQHCECADCSSMF